MKTSIRSLLKLAALVALCHTSSGATYLWNSYSGNWNDNANWQPNSGNPGASDTAWFGDTGVVFDTSVPNNTVSVNTTVAALNFTNTTAATWHVTQIPAGVTLTVSNLNVGYSAATGASSASGANTSAAMVDGGTLVVQGNVSVGNSPGATPIGLATLDLSGLSNFIFNNSSGTLQLSVINRTAGHLKLAAASNYISAATVNLNTASGSSTAAGTVTLGSGTNIINAANINAAIQRNSCTIQFADANGGLRIRGTAGDDSSRANLTLGNRNSSGTGGTSTGTLSLDGHPVDIKLGTLNLGMVNGGSGTANIGTGSISFDTGIVDVTTVNMALTANATASGNATINVGPAGSLIVGSGGMSLANLFAGGVAANGTLNVAGGSVTCSNSITKGNTGGVGAIAVTAGVLRMAGGTIGTPAIPIDTLSLGDSALNLAVGPSGTNVVVNTLTMTSSTNNMINIIALPIITSYPVQFPLIRYGMGSSDCMLGSLPPGYTGTLVNGAGSVDLLISSGPITIRPLFWSGTPNGNWDTTTANWRYLSNPSAYSQADLVTLDDTATGTTTVNLTTTLTPGSLTVSNISKAYTFNGSGSLDGAIALVKAGAGQLTLANSGVNTFSNGVSIQGGTVLLSGSANRLPTTAGATLAEVPGAILDLNSFNQALQSLNGGGFGGGEVKLGSANLAVAGGGTFGGVISGTGQLIKTNFVTGGTLNLTNANTYSGGTIVGGYTNNTTLAIGNETGSGTGPGYVRVLTNGTFAFGAGGPGGSAAAGVITNEGTVRLSRSDEFVFPNIIVGPGNLLAQGSGTAIIQGTNGHTGGTTVSQGILRVGNPGALGPGSITVQNGAPCALQLSNSITLANAMTIASKPSAAGQVPNIENVSGTNTITGPLTLTQNGSIGWGFYATAGHLRITGTNATLLPSQTSQNTTRILQLRGDATGEWSGSINDTLNSVTNLALTKAGLGTWTLSGYNNYSGPTIVNEGTLLVNGSLAAASAVTVNAGTLGGNGVIRGPVSVLGTLAPGASIGTLTISNNLSLFGTTTMEVSHSACDKVKGVNDLALGGGLQVVVSGALQGNEVFKLFDAKTITGDFVYDLPALTSPLAWDASAVPINGTLKVTGGTLTPPPLQVSQSGNQLTFSWDHVSFKLQSQTNNLSTGLRSNWSDYPGGDSSPVTVPINPANPTVFFRLISQ